MRRREVRMLQGLAVLIAGIGISGAAHAQTFYRWQNANTANGIFYLGVSGGQVCNPANGQCGVAPGTQLITWQKAGDDQKVKEILPSGGFVDLQDYEEDPWAVAGTCLTVSGQSNSENASLVTESTSCLSDPYARWLPEAAENLGAPFPHCFAFQNQQSGLFMSVSQGIVKNASHIVQWPLCIPGEGVCGAPTNAYHADQFWCPVTP